MNINSDSLLDKLKKTTITTLLIPSLLFGTVPTLNNVQSVRADDELARFAAEGNDVGVDGTCFMKKCSLETAKCANDPNCLKGLSCLARCKGGSMCSTGCFAKFGSDNLDGLLACSVEKNDCVHVPRDEEAMGWKDDKLADLPTKPIEKFAASSLDGTWYKVMGLDSRYDCFECQRNTFKVSPPTFSDINIGNNQMKDIEMEALFRIPRPTAPGYLQSRIQEKLQVTNPNNFKDKNSMIANADRNTNTNINSNNYDVNLKESATAPTFQSQGTMFGLTFWENWYVIGDSRIQPLGPGQAYSFGVPSAYAQGPAESYAPDMKLIFYTGHTLQGSYKGAFLYSRSPKMGAGDVKVAQDLISRSGLNPNDFCMIKNACFLNDDGSKNEKVTKFGDVMKSQSASSGSTAPAPAQFAMDNSPSIRKEKTPFWFLGQGFLQSTSSVANELSDWFDDPSVLSDWLLEQQERMVFTQPLAVSPFASLPEDEGT